MSRRKRIISDELGPMSREVRRGDAVNTVRGTFPDLLADLRRQPEEPRD